MGASGWDYVVDLPEGVPADPSAALVQLRERVLGESDFLWADWLGPRPTTLAELDAIRQTDEFWDEGTHSVLDVDRIIPSGPDREAAVQELPADEAEEVFGTPTPTRAQFEAAGVDLLPWGARWSGRYQLLHDGGRPTSIAFWGASGD